MKIHKSNLELMAKIPKAKFSYGDYVDVKIVEAGYPPSFRAIICGIKMNHDEIDYTVMDNEGSMSDGYTERWLEASSNKEGK